MVRFEYIIAGLSIIGGFISVVFTFVVIYQSDIARKNKLEDARELKFQNAMESDDLKKVGSFLYNTIGNFNVYEYISNTDVENTVDKYIDKLTSFVKTDTYITKEIEEVAWETNGVKYTTELEILHLYSEEISKVIDELDYGEVWNALARLRRHIEITLNEIAKENDIIIERPTAGHLLDILIRKEIISIDAKSQLKYAISVCNQAIHGIEVSTIQAQEAVFHANNGLNIVKTSST